MFSISLARISLLTGTSLGGGVGVSPTLDLNFRGQGYSAAMAGYTFNQLIDFTRTSAATYVDATGKIVPTPASRNLLTFTQEFDNAAWGKLNASAYSFDPATASYGPELVTNGNFSGGATGWTLGDWVISSGQASATATSTSLYGGQFTPVAGRVYRVEFDIISYASGTLNVTVGGNFTTNVNLTGAAAAPGRKSVFVTAGSTPARAVEFYGGSVTATIDNISVKELSGGLIAAPDGTLTADTLVENTAAGVHYVSETVTGTSVGATYTASVYAKPNGRNWIILEMSGATIYASFNVATGAVGTTLGSPTTTITPVGNGWYRCSMTKAIGAAISAIRVYTASADNTTSYTGDGTSGIYLWGAQLEAVPDANLVLGSELVTNGDFSGGTTGWLTAGSPSFSVTSGIASVTRTTFGDIAYQAVTCVIGRTYKVTGTVVSGATARIGFSSAAVGGAGEVVNSGSAGTYSTLVVANATTMYVVLTTSTNGTSATFDNISVKEITAITGMPTDYTRNNGGVYPPRFDYDPVTLAPKGLLVEEQRTNLMLRSEEVGTSPWTANSITITANSTTAPDGTSTADTLTAAAGTNLSTILNQDVSVSGTNTFSFYAKAGTHNFIQLMNTGDVQAFANFNISTGVVGTAGTKTTATITPAGNGWYRCVATFASTTAYSLNFRVYMVQAANSIYAAPWSPAGTETVFLWGAQLEAGSFATSYIPTVASQVTRTADVAAITGANFSQWYNQSEGTFVVAGSSFTVPSFSYPLLASDNSYANRFGIYTSSSSAAGLVVSSSVTQMDISASSIVANVPFKAAVAAQANSGNFSLNGSIGTTDTTITMPVVNRLTIGAGFVGIGEYINGHIRSIRYYPTRLSNAQLQALTA